MHQPLFKTHVFKAALLRQRNRKRLQIIVAQDQRRHVLGHVGQERVSCLPREPPVAHRPRQRDLDVNLEVGGIHAGRIIDSVGIKPDAAQRCLDAAALRHPEIGPLADHFGAHFGAGDADCIVATISDRIVAFRRGADIGSNAAEEEKIDRRSEDGPDHVVRRRLGGGEAERRARL